MKTSKHLRIGPAFALAGFVLAVATFVTGCGTMPTAPQSNPKAKMEAPHSEAIILREGDILKITFPGSPNLDTLQPIRRDGKLNLPLIGEITAAGVTPSDLQKKLVDLYSSQISSKEIIVQVQSSTFPVFVSGAVMHPGKVNSDHPLDALEAVMEAGGFNYDTANMKEVRIVRNENGEMKNYVVNLRDALVGKKTKPFYLQPNDIVYVPERFSPF